MPCATLIGPKPPLALIAAMPATNSTSPTGRVSTGPLAPPSPDYLRLPSVDISEGGPKRNLGTEALSRAEPEVRIHFPPNGESGACPTGCFFQGARHEPAPPRWHFVGGCPAFAVAAQLFQSLARSAGRCRCRSAWAAPRTLVSPPPLGAGFSLEPRTRSDTRGRISRHR
jgi:hypothetical protein